MNLPSGKPHRVLFVCSANICRSPAAEIIFRKRAAEAGRGDEFEVDSAGTLAQHHGSPPDPRMAENLERHGYRVTGRSRRVEAADLEKFDLVVAMDESHLAHLRELAAAGIPPDKIVPLVSFCRTHEDFRVPDPYYGGRRGFDHVIALLEDGCKGILESFPKIP